MNKNATYKKIFATIENSDSLTYSTLPERTISEKLYKLRKLKGYSRHNFANICKIGYSSVVKYETNLSTPNEINIHKICTAFNIPNTYFNR